MLGPKLFKDLFLAAADHSDFLPSTVLKQLGLFCVLWNLPREAWLSGTEPVLVTSVGTLRQSHKAWPSTESQWGVTHLFFFFFFLWHSLCLKCFVVTLFVKCLDFKVLILCFGVYGPGKGDKSLIAYLHQRFHLWWYSLSWWATLLGQLWHKWGVPQIKPPLSD